MNTHIDRQTDGQTHRRTFDALKMTAMQIGGWQRGWFSKRVELARAGSGTNRATPSSFVTPAHSEIPNLSSELGKQRYLLWDISWRELNKYAFTHRLTFKTLSTSSCYLEKEPLNNFLGPRLQNFNFKASWYHITFFSSRTFFLTFCQSPDLMSNKQSKKIWRGTLIW